MQCNLSPNGVCLLEFLRQLCYRAQTNLKIVILLPQSLVWQRQSHIKGEKVQSMGEGQARWKESHFLAASHDASDGKNGGVSISRLSKGNLGSMGTPKDPKAAL